MGADLGISTESHATWPAAEPSGLAAQPIRNPTGSGRDASAVADQGSIGRYES